jgi:hypothetical protein
LREARGAALDHVAGEGKRRAHEADHRHLTGQRAHHVLNGLADIAQVVGIGRRKAVYAGIGVDRRGLRPIGVTCTRWTVPGLPSEHDINPRQ